ncbi:MAG: hypothetical protein V1820_03245 [archaeon]
MEIAALETQPSLGNAAAERGSENFRRTLWLVVGLVVAGIVAVFVFF